MEGLDIDTDLTTQSILLASAHRDIPALRDLLRNSSANVQDSETGFTPLHAAIAALELDQDDEDTTQKPPAVNGHTNGETNHEAPKDEEMEAAVKTVKFLLQNGAIWNDLDANDETAGCIAARLGLKELYDLMVDAGVRAELLLTRLGEYQPLGDGDSDEDEEEDKEEEDAEEPTDEQALSNQGDRPSEIDAAANNESYLSQPVTISENQILDNSTNGVMMSWESPIMERSAELLLPVPGLRVLNIGHGMGIIDGHFQDRKPSEHHIIEAHPDVLTQMRAQGWYEKPGVVIHEGRWQDEVVKLMEQSVYFDAVYFDTFAEEYKALREFIEDCAQGMLHPDGGENKDGGILSFFNGMGADRKICYDVYNKVVEMDLFESNFDVQWEDIPVPDLSAAGEWDGVKRPYWRLDTYRLPICKLMD